MINRHQPTPVFVVGCGRSGTTFTASLLNRLSGVHISKETGFIGQNLTLLQSVDQPASLRALIDVTNSWLRVERWEQLASADGFHAFCNDSGLNGAPAFVNYVWQLESPTPWHQLQFIGDNTPLYVTCIPALQQWFPSARFIHLVRDPRDVVCSTVRMRFGSSDLIAAAMDWHSTLACWLMAERTLDPSNRLECRYEDLCRSPYETFGKLAEFLGRDRSESDAIVESFSMSTKAESGFDRVATLPHHARLTEPLNASRVERFRTELTSTEIRRIEQILQNGMRACGYEFSEWQVSPLMKDDRLFTLRAMIRDAVKRCWRKIRR